jgi:hypothetical protein
LEFLLNRYGLRVDSKKTQGLFNKNAMRTGIFYSEPLDLDLTARAKGGARWQRWVAGDHFPRRRVARGSPEFIAFDAPGVKSTGFWVREVHYAMRDSPEH